eukprot:1278691-Rhodomonas_salina.3
MKKGTQWHNTTTNIGHGIRVTGCAFFLSEASDFTAPVISVRIHLPTTSTSSYFLSRTGCRRPIPVSGRPRHCRSLVLTPDSNTNNGNMWPDCEMGRIPTGSMGFLDSGRNS